jgi:thymidylate synthase (FAD)
MSSILNAYTSFHEQAFVDYILSLDMFVVTGFAAKLEAQQLWDKLSAQESALGEQEFIELSIAKSSIPLLSDKLGTSLFNALQAGKQKRNVGDAFKWVVTDNWKVDMVVTFNLRSLKNYFTLRDSGAAFFQIQWLAQAMKEVTPSKYLDLIIK